MGGSVKPEQDFYAPAPAKGQEPEQDFYALPAAKASPGDFYTEFPDTTVKPDATRALATVKGMPFAKRHPIVNALVVQPFKDASDALVIAFTPQSHLDLLAKEDPDKMIEMVHNGQRGLAFMASLPVGAAFTKIPLVTRAFGAAGAATAGLIVRPAAQAAFARVFGHASAFLAGEFLSGSVYGAIEPLEPNQSRVGNVLTEGAIFAAFGGTVAGSLTLAGRGFRRYIIALPRAKRIEAIRLVQERLGQMDADLRAAGTNLNAMPPDAKASVVTQVYKSVLDDLVGPREIDVDKIVREEATRAAAMGDEAIEPHTRFGPEAKTGLKVGPIPEDVQLPDPIGEIELRPEFKVPAKIEPVGKPKGFVEGAGTPEREPTTPIRLIAEGSRDQMEAVGLISKNTIPGEKPWRLTTWLGMEAGAAPAGHKEFASRAEALKFATEHGYVEGPAKSERLGEEYVTGPVVMGKSGKIYPGPTHPQAIADAIDAGTPASEFEFGMKVGPSSELERHMGFATSKQVFVSRRTASEIADRYVGMPPRSEPIDSRALMGVEGQPGLVPVDAPPSAWNASNRHIEQGSTAAELQRTTDDVLTALEPHEVTPGRPAPAGFEPTIVGERAGASSQVEQLGLTNAAVKDAVARIDPLTIADVDVRAERVVLEDAFDDPTVPTFATNKQLAAAMDRALAQQGPASAEDLLLQLTSPTPGEIVLGQKVPRQMAKKLSAQLSKSLERESEDLIEISPTELVRASWAYGPSRAATPSLDVLQTVVRMSDDQIELLGERLRKMAMGDVEPTAPTPRASPTDALRNLSDEELAALPHGSTPPAEASGLAKGGIPGALPKSIIERERLRNIGGFITGRALALILGAGAETASFNDDLDPGTQNVLRAVGGLLLAASIYGPVKTAMKEGKFMRNLLLNLNPEFLMKDGGSREGFRKLKETLTWSRELAHNQRKMIEGIFKPQDYRNAVIAIEESDFARGVFPMEYHQLGPGQQKAVEALNLFNLALGQILHSEGILKAYRRNYVSHKLPPETFQRWVTHGFRTLPTAGGFTKQRIFTFRELEAWTAQNQLKGPITDLAELQSKHISEAYRALGNVRLTKMLENLGQIQDIPTNALTPAPTGWRQLRIAGQGTKMAPDAVASGLENLATSPQSSYEPLNALDTVKSYWMRSIMFWCWEHGTNALRGAVLSSLNPALYGESWKAIERMDPGVIEATKYGLNMRQRTDYGVLAKSVENMIQKVGNIPVLGQVTKLGGALMKFNETALWEKIVPSMQYMVYSKEMFKWGEHTAGKFLPGSAEYTTAARKAADVANTVLGRLPTDLANPKLMQWMRLVLFSPQWTTTRVAMTAHAAGELGEILNGTLKPTQATYLPMKLRQVAYMATLTYLGSHFLSGKDPEFNPKTHKLYMKTGMKNASGRDVGIDMVGFWQDDLKMFNTPFDYISGRLNPALKVIGETVNGRDYLGRPMTGIQKIENVVRSAGVPLETAELMVRAGQTALPGGAPGMSKGEMLNRASGVLALFNVATLPRPIDAAIGKFATKLLLSQGLADDENSVFELSRLLRGNLMAGHSLVDQRVITYLAYRRRNRSIQSPLATPVEQLWAEGRRVLADF